MKVPEEIEIHFLDPKSPYYEHIVGGIMDVSSKDGLYSVKLSLSEGLTTTRRFPMVRIEEIIETTPSERNG